MATTTNYNQLLPTVGGSEGTWGLENNNLHQKWDTELFATVYRNGSRAFTGAQAFAVGTVTAPGLTFSGDANTGFYWVGADSFAVTLGGAAKATFSTTALTLAAGVKLACATTTASLAPLGLGQAAAGVTPSGRANGDLWANADGLFCRIAGNDFNLTAPPGSGVASFNTRTGTVTLTSGDVTGALGFTPVTNARTVTGSGMLAGGGALTSNQAITMANVANNTIVGNNSGASAAPTALSAADAAALLNPSINLSAATIGSTDVTGDGYIKLGGFYFMWGTSLSTSSDNSVTVNLPVTVLAMLEGSIQATPRNPSSPSVDRNVEIQFVSATSTTITFFLNAHGSSPTNPAGFNWFAIGLA